ncbi:SAM-dependent methyltransferase [Deinococcus irradiatisoli]|uniref:SAM-dependent methyltransferase n=1 Tax=Deinococcus irradiatisoli TaxID=2202254 RepID=A0A2Z3JDN3_9DEIO|nr:cyclopropane-fatty-acyl-phospholipid synthase family protein [Deinococcus irradiatisoli]AWN22146.1 SAM-dependent methyltransferase [Deinococcus irradiatisoli]
MPKQRPSPLTPAQIAALSAAALTTTAVLAAQARPPATAGAVRDAALRLLQLGLPSRRRFSTELWDGTTLPATAGEDARLKLNSPKTLGRMLRLPLDVALGEAYIRGDFDIEGDFSALVELADTFDAAPGWAAVPGLLRDYETLRRGAGAPPPAPRASLEGEAHSRERDKAAVQHHYDVSNDFYKLWLDERMVYSCGYFPNGDETLDQAQAAKLELVCRKLRLQPGEKLLDIGCGWGGLAIYAAQHYGVSVLGVTLSEAQLKEAQARVQAAGLGHLVTLELRDYRDVQGPFDKVSSVGMAEHVGRKNMAEYFATAYRVLRPGGLMLNHAIASGLDQAKVSNLLQSGNFARRYVFPDGELLPIWETQKFAEEARFEVRDVENLREHYSQTTQHWARNLEARQEEALASLGEERYRLWRIYLNACVYYFRAGHLSIFQTLLAKPDEQRHVPLPRSRADLYR